MNIRGLLKGRLQAALILMLICMLLAGCGTALEGNWKVTGVRIGETTQTYDEYISSCGIDDYNVDNTLKVEIYSSGTYKLILFGDEISGQWVTEEDKSYLLMGSSRVEAVLKGSTLSLELNDGVFFEFEK